MPNDGLPEDSRDRDAAQIRLINEEATVPLVANGDVSSLDDIERISMVCSSQPMMSLLVLIIFTCAHWQRTAHSAVGCFLTAEDLNRR